MKRCILHIGMPKTGTSSIQHFLFYGLKDARFQYFSFGEVDSCRGIGNIFMENPLQETRNIQQGWSMSKI